MGIFDRIKQSMKSTAESAVRGVEERNPEAVYESAIDNRIERVAELKGRLAAMVQRRAGCAERVVALEAEVVQLGQALEGALSDGDDETALVLQVRRNEVVSELEARTTTLAELTALADETKASWIAMRDGVETLKNDRDRDLAQHAAAQAAIEIDETVSGLSEAAHVRALDTVRDSVGALERRAHPGYLDADGNSVRGRAAGLGRKAAEESAQAQLDMLKRQRGGAGETSEVSEASEAADEDTDEPPRRTL